MATKKKSKKFERQEEAIDPIYELEPVSEVEMTFPASTPFQALEPLRRYKLLYGKVVERADGEFVRFEDVK